jgi:hypothetical protein
MIMENYCLLTGGRCSHYPITVRLNQFFISEPYDEERVEREKAIKKAIEGFPYIIADNKVMNIALTCKICQQIQSSQFGIADITGCNKNVLIELGMLYGFKKPTIISLKESETTEINIPSNIRGIEQIRYENFEKLAEGIKEATSTLFELRKKMTEYILDMKPMLELQISDIELEVQTRHLVEVRMKGQIVDSKIIGNVALLIVDKGTKHGMRKGMIFEVYRCDKVANGNYLEENVGLIVITHVQEKISQCQPVKIEPDIAFWKDASTGIFPRNIVRPYLRKAYEPMTTEQLGGLLSKIKILHEYMFFGRTD